MRIVGNPQLNNENVRRLIQNNVHVSEETLRVDKEYLSEILNRDKVVLDIGSSLRSNSEFVSGSVKKLDTLDINEFENYPDIQMDLCEKMLLPPDLKYDVIFCFSILEHCYDPFTASQNLFGMLKKNSLIVGSAPFLFPYHCPTDLEYQDFFRFTKHSYAVLFPNATRIELTPMRGRVGAGLNIISQKYKDIIEAKFPKVVAWINSLDLKRKPEQTSGFHFEIYN